jgi:hypothetical protein
MQLWLWCCWDCKEVAIARVGRHTKWFLQECKDLQRKDQESSWLNDYKKGVSCWRQSPSLPFTFETFSESCALGGLDALLFLMFFLIVQLRLQV